jgi:TAG lipase/steryl ester hydrolase/phospholipase A2/LPA acyltransferase
MDTIVSSIDAVLNANPNQYSNSTAEDLSIENKLAFFSETRHAFGRSALLLSGGGTLSWYHPGVVRTLLEQNMLPLVISGSSGGTLVAGVVGTHTDQEILEYISSHNHDTSFFSFHVDPEDFERCTPRLFRYMKAFLPSRVIENLSFNYYLLLRAQRDGYIFSTDRIREVIQHNHGDYTFQEAYDRTGRILNITVTPQENSDYPRLLNYLTAPNVLVWSASLASCAIPLLFSPVELLVKDKQGNITPYSSEGLHWTDGSVECDLPMERLSELFNVNHFIVSQVNVHYKIFSGHSTLGMLHSYIGFLKQQLKSTLAHTVDFLFASKLSPVVKVLGFGVVPFVTQRYEGDITICPVGHLNMFQLVRGALSNIDMDSVRVIADESSQATFPHLARIRTLCRIEFALERAVRHLRSKQVLEVYISLLV